MYNTKLNCLSGIFFKERVAGINSGSHYALKGPLRSNGSQDDQAGEAGPVEQSSAEAKSLKTKGQGTARLPPQWATTEVARRGAKGPNKGLLSR